MKRFLCLLLSLLMLLSVVACFKNESVSDDSQSDVRVVEDESSVGELKDIEVSSDVDESKIIILEDDVSGDSEVAYFIFYSDIDNNIYRKKVGLQVDTDIALAMRVLEEIGVSKPGLKGIKFDEESNSVTIDFKSDASVLQSGTAGETQILQSLALTYILGKNVDSIYYNVDGEIYSSGHYYFEPDGFYISKNILLNNWDELFPKVVTQ